MNITVVLSSDETLPHVVNMIRNNHLAVFLGSGASKSAGLPLAGELRDKITSRLGLKSRQDLTLEQLLQDIKDRQGKDAFAIIKDSIGNADRIPSGYNYLASLVKHQFVKIILTTNYDNLMEFALTKELGSKFTVVATNEEYEKFDVNVSPPDPVFFKLHGTIDNVGSMEGAWEDVQEFPKEKSRILLPYFQNYGMLFIGYACADADVNQLITQSLVMRRNRKSFVVTSSQLTANIGSMLEMLKSNTNHIQSTSDEFLKEALMRIMNISKTNGIPQGLVESNVRKIFERENVKRAMIGTPEQIRQRDFQQLEQNIQSRMDEAANVIRPQGLTVYANRRIRHDWQGKTAHVSKRHVEEVTNRKIDDLECLVECDFEIRLELKGVTIMPILFSLTDILDHANDSLIAVWTLFLSDEFPYGKLLEKDSFTFFRTPEDFLKFENWFQERLTRCINYMERVGSQEPIERD